MRIAVISDTHNKLPVDILPFFHGADELWHLGDVCAPSTLDDLYSLGIPLQVILGNNDFADWPISITREIHGFSFHITHIPPSHTPPGARFILHGHTHIPRDETLKDGSRWLNPGSLSFPRHGHSPSFAWLEISPGKPVSWEPVFLPGKT